MWSPARPLAGSSRPTTAQTSPGTAAHVPLMHSKFSPTAASHPVEDHTAGDCVPGHHTAEASAEGANTADAALAEHHADSKPERAQTLSTVSGSGNTTSSDSSSEGDDAEAAAEGACTEDAAVLKPNAIGGPEQALNSSMPSGSGHSGSDSSNSDSSSGGGGGSGSGSGSGSGRGRGSGSGSGKSSSEEEHSGQANSPVKSGINPQANGHVAGAEIVWYSQLNPAKGIYMCCM